MSKLVAIHATSQNETIENKQPWLKYIGLDLAEGKVRNNLEAGVLEPMVSKVKQL